VRRAYREASTFARAVGDEVVPRPRKPARVTRCSGCFDGTIPSLAEYATDPDSLGGAP